MKFNPYQPPQYLGEANQWQENRLWRAGNFLVVGENALFPSRCFLTGRPTNDSYEFKAIWEPSWLWFLIPLGLLPYFFVAPFYQRQVNIRIPIDKDWLAKFRRINSVGHVLGALSILTCFGMFYWRSLFDVAFQNLSLAFFIIGILLANYMIRRKPKLDIVSMDGPYMVLAGVHPDILNSLPAFLAKSEKLFN